MSETEKSPYDVVELCALLQCLGFQVKSIDCIDGNYSQESVGDGVRTIVINCQASGLHVELESGYMTCSCPSAVNQQNSSVWQVSGMAGGKQMSKEYGSELLGTLPKAHRERLTKELMEIVRRIKSINEYDIDTEKPKRANRSASLENISTPAQRHLMLKTDTPTRCRSLETLTTAKDEVDHEIPAPRQLQKQSDNSDIKKIKCRRQSTYTISSAPESIRRRNITSSPIQQQNSLLQNLIAAEKLADELRHQLTYTIKEYMEDGKNDSSISSLALDVSKISELKGPEVSKMQFSSSPNLSGMGVHDDIVRKLKRTDSASTSSLVQMKPIAKDGKLSKLRRLTPSLFKSKVQNKNSQLNTLVKPKIVTPVRIPKSENSPNLSSTSKKKFSHVKSTIPRPTSRKE